MIFVCVIRYDLSAGPPSERFNCQSQESTNSLLKQAMFKTYVQTSFFHLNNMSLFRVMW